VALHLALFALLFIDGAAQKVEQSMHIAVHLLNPSPPPPAPAPSQVSPVEPKVVESPAEQPLPQPVVQQEQAAAPAETAPRETSSSEPVTINSELAANCSQRSAPSYPMLARRRGEEGRVVLRVVLGADGAVQEAAVAQSSHSALLDAAALATVRSWHCTPATRSGKPVTTIAMQPFDFVLNGR